MAFAALALAFAWQSLNAAEPFGRDRAVLAALDGRSLGDAVREWGTLAPVLDPDRGHPLAAFSTAASVTTFGSDVVAANDGERAPDALLFGRVENLLWYLLASFALARFLRRFFLPWTGSDQAEAAGWAAALFFALSPLSYPLVASLASRGEVLSLALGTSAAAIFLAGRQDYSVRRQGLALALAVGAGLASDLAFFLPPVLAVAEYVSARRQRPRAVRVRTTATTLVVFGAAVSLSLVVRAASGAPFVLPGAWNELVDALGDGRWAAVSVGTLEKLGLVVLPINAWALGLFGQGVAGVLLLVAIQPGLLAARTAPRLWSFLLGLITGIFALALGFAPFEGVSSHDLTNSGALVLPAMVLCAALGAGATALSGTRRWLVPVVFAAGSAFLAHFNAVPWVRASHALSWLAGSVAEARATHGAATQVIVLDPPRATLGVDVVAGALGVLGALDEGGPDAKPVLGLARGALALYAHGEACRESARDGLVLLVPSAPSEGVDPTFSAFESRTPILLRLGGQTGAASKSRRWFNDGRSPSLDLASLEHLALIVRAKPDADTSRPPRVGWRAGDESTHEHTGVWWRRGGEPTAVFDLASSLEWLASEHVARVWSAEGWAVTSEAELAAVLPAIAGAAAPTVDGDDWAFTPDAEQLAPEDLARARWTLTLLADSDLASRQASLVAEAGDGGSSLRFASAERAARTLGPCLWSLELELDGRAVARSFGSR
ncbi:MAG: hypothetical protein IT453_21075 [Planctomycetes bacterium]|nr:hypothetical protein [Planctomycetota bacterium]